MICVESVTVSPGSASIKAGNWYYGASAHVYPSNADCTEVTWHSDNTSVATVNASSGHIYAKAPGTAKIYATATDGSGCQDYIQVSVYSTVPVECVNLNYTNISLEEGESTTLTAWVCPENATNKSVNWHSSNNSVATVSGGVVTAVSRGNATITATAADGSGCSASCSVTVTGNIPVTCITVDPRAGTLVVGQSAFPSAIVCPVDATNKCVVWSSSNTAVATVNPDSGLIIARSAGSAIIYATAQDGSGVVGTCVLTVTAPICVTGLCVCPTSKTMYVGDTDYLCKTVYPLNATDQTVTWCSSNENVATVNTFTGLIHAKKAGTTIITATTADGEFTACCDVVVAYSATINEKKIVVFGEDDELLDNCTDEEPTGLYVYANDMLLTSAREETNGDITVCMGEIVQALCTESYLNPTYTEWHVSTSHKDLQVFREKTYYTSELGLCPIDHINDRISLNQFIADMGYSSKYSSISYSNGTKIIIIQGHDWYSSVSISALSTADFASLTLGLLPVIGDAKDLAEGIIGIDMITGEPLSPLDRVLCLACTLIPVAGGSTVRVGKKGLAKIQNVVHYIDNLPEAKKVILHSDIWEILRPITRGLCVEAAFAESVYTAARGWAHIGKEMNGFFPVIDFIKTGTRLEDTIVISMKTLDPRLYKLANGSYNYTKIQNVINTYTHKLRTEKMFIDNVTILNRQLDLVVPKGYAEIISQLDDINKKQIVFNLIEL